MIFSRKPSDADVRKAVELDVNPRLFALSKKQNPEQLRTAIEDVVNPQVFALRKEYAQQENENFKRIIANYSELSERISKLETAAITPVTSRKVKRPKRKVSGNARKR